jgi:streptogramin lyase
VLGLAGCGGGEEEERSGTPALVALVKDPIADQVAVGEGAVWFSHNHVGVISRADPESNDVVGDIEIGDHEVRALATGEGALWVSDLSKVSRIDPETNEVVARIEIGGGEALPAEIAVGEGTVWVGNHVDNTLFRIDPDTNEVTGPPIEVGEFDSIAVGEGAVWVANGVEEGVDTVTRIDPKTNRIAGEPIRTMVNSDSPANLAVGEGAVWVTHEVEGAGALLSRIDPDTNRVSGKPTELGQRGRGDQPIAVGEGAGWVGGRSSVFQVDPKTGKTTLIEIPGLFSATGIAVGEGAVWVAGDGGIWRIDPFAKGPSEIGGQPYYVGVDSFGHPSSVAVGEGAVWATAGPDVALLDPRHGSDSLEMEQVDSTVDWDVGPLATGEGWTWVVNSAEKSVTRIRADSFDDPAELDTALPNSEEIEGIAAGEGGVWVVGAAPGEVARVDPQTGEVSTLALPRDELIPTAVAVGGGAVWFSGGIAGERGTEGQGYAWRTDATGEPLGELISLQGIPTDIAVGEGAVWVSYELDDKIARIDPETNRPGEPIVVGDEPRALAVGEGAVWVANYADDTVSRIDPESSEPIGDPIPVQFGPVDVAVGSLEPEGAGAVWVACDSMGSVVRINPRQPNATHPLTG